MFQGNIWEQILSTKILFESVCSVPFIVSVRTQLFNPID